ncbi:energy transducer TonB [Aestuariibaculum sp. M13]|uniref:energy transducer TonB n=1 Tax=Aestuariibaculum sp. M13 TaxID=2967132 RepID=UPI00215A0905|nr:energy transducer TonB [Aestuariibaculum sp. M13]MCR8669512.1 energy transducer TonB [Aestuariibaculum sp. M13]
MSNQKKTHDLIRQNEQIVKKSQKHEANLQKNTTLYFQIGLIVCLLSAYGLLEMKFQSELPMDFGDVFYDDGPQEIDVENYEVYQEKVDIPEPPQPELPDTDLPPEVIENDSDIEPTDNFKAQDEPSLSNSDLDPDKIKLVDAPTVEPAVSFIRVEQVPIYPGCEKEKDNAGRKKCMSDKITKLIQRKFNTGLGGEYGLSGKQVIRTRFTIDKKGEVKDLQIRAPHPELKNEAERVIDFIPVMTPGKQRDKNVDVIYDLPIIFEVQD